MNHVVSVEGRVIVHEIDCRSFHVRSIEIATIGRKRRKGRKGKAELEDRGIRTWRTNIQHSSKIVPINIEGSLSHRTEATLYSSS